MTTIKTEKNFIMEINPNKAIDEIVMEANRKPNRFYYVAESIVKRIKADAYMVSKCFDDTHQEIRLHMSDGVHVNLTLHSPMDVYNADKEPRYYISSILVFTPAKSRAILRPCVNMCEIERVTFVPKG